MVFLEHPWLLRTDGDSIDDAGPGDAHEYQRRGHSSAAGERWRDRSVLYPANHHAAVRRRKTDRHDRTSGHFPDHRHGSDPREMARSHAALRMHVAAHRAEFRVPL